MPVADQLIDGAALHVVLSFMDGYSGYNQILIAEEDIPKTAFRCPGCLLELEMFDSKGIDRGWINSNSRHAQKKG